LPSPLRVTVQFKEVAEVKLEVTHNFLCMI
jgi:hypothetical protein